MRETGAFGDADRDLESRSFMVLTRMSVARQRLAIGRSSAGVPRTYRIARSSSWATRLAGLRTVLQALRPGQRVAAVTRRTDRLRRKLVT
jgi:hypothetical protein